jgi:hypothetical protein
MEILRKLSVLVVFVVSFIVFIPNTSFAKMSNMHPCWQRLIVSNARYDAASISDDGKSIVFTQNDPKDNPLAIYISHVRSSGLYTTPQLVASFTTKINGTHLHIISFAPFQIDRAATNFNGPMLDNGIITFTAIASNNKAGVFYAQKQNRNYVINAIAWEGSSIANQKQLITSLNAPYISHDKIYYLANLANNRQVIIQYDLYNKQNTILLDSDYNQKHIYNFWNMSLYQHNFAIRAMQNNQEGIYRVNAGNQQITQFATDHLIGFNHLFKEVGGPSLFNKEVAFALFAYESKQSSESNARPKYSAIYTNAMGHNINIPIVMTGQFTPMSNNHFAFIGNPTLSINQHNAYIAFEGSIRQNPSISGVYLALVNHQYIRIIKILIPGEVFDGKYVMQASLGPVGLRQMIMPVLVRFNDRTSGVYVANLNIRCLFTKNTT